VYHCGVCEPECPVEAIKPDTEPGLEKWLEVNAEYAKSWPNITVKRDPPPDAKEWDGVPDKFRNIFSAPEPVTDSDARAEPNRVRADTILDPPDLNQTADLTLLTDL
jgi:ferredoxin